MSLIRPKRQRRATPTVESLEGRALLSGPGHALPALARPAIASRIHTAIRVDPGGYAAILSALNGGLGSEWVKLIRAQVHNLSAVIGGFVSGKFTSYSIPGLTVKTPNVQPQFAGQPYDQLLANVAGASVFKGNVLELGAIMRGPFHDPATSYYVFALNRGAGANLGPTFASKPGITPDTLVTLTVGPYGSSASGTITDLTNGSITADRLVEYQDQRPRRPRVPEDRASSPRRDYRSRNTASRSGPRPSRGPTSRPSPASRRSRR